jgi:stage II sporulation protein GA (sporulation sigma-E factor processing peptidase)
LKIYLDVLIITNSIVTLIYLQCICRIVHQKIGTKREAAACAAGGIGSLIAMAETSSFIGAFAVTAAKACIITAVILIAFTPGNFADYAKRFFLYILIELIFGGSCFMLVNATHKDILCIRNYTVYFDISLVEIAVCCAFVYILIIVCETVQRKKADSAQKYVACYSVGKYEISMPAIADTGNRLCDSFTGAPVVIFCSDELYKRYNLDRGEQLAFYGFHPVPYSTVNGVGLIYVTSKGSTRITSKNLCKDVDCCIGILPEDNCGRRAIFNPCILL